jgi:threonine/homoserine/homoserine lactone efflux protein
MSYLPQLAAVAGVMFLACVSPGPDLVAVTSHALVRRRSGLGVAAGISSSHLLWAALAVFGLGMVVSQMAWLYGAIRLAGAIYLIYLGGKILLSLRTSDDAATSSGSSPSPSASAASSSSAGSSSLASPSSPSASSSPIGRAPERSVAQSYRKGLLVGLTNPKAAAFFGSLFVTLLPAHAPTWVHCTTVLIVAGVSACWFFTIAILFSTGRVQQGYARLRKPIDALMGVALVALGAKLALDR